MKTFFPFKDDNVGEPCNCLDCQAAGVTAFPIVRVPGDEHNPKPHWLHGDPLRRWWQAREDFMTLLKQATVRQMPAGRGER